MNSTKRVCRVNSILMVITEDVSGQFPVEARIFAMMFRQQRVQQQAKHFDKPVFPDIRLGATTIGSE